MSRQTQDIIQTASQPKEGTQPLSFTSKYAQNFMSQVGAASAASGMLNVFLLMSCSSRHSSLRVLLLSRSMQAGLSG